MSDLIQQLEYFDLENALDLALEMRKARRERYSARAKKGWAHRRSADRAAGKL